NNLATIAFVHGEVARHTVLPVLACKELVMSADARLGPVVLEGEPALTPTKVQGYKDVSKGRSRWPALVLKLLDKDMEVLQGIRTRDGAVAYLDAAQEQAEKKDGIVVTNREPVVGKGPAAYTRALAEKVGLCQGRAETREEVQRDYSLPPTSLREY